MIAHPPIPANPYGGRGRGRGRPRRSGLQSYLARQRKAKANPKNMKKTTKRVLMLRIRKSKWLYAVPLLLKLTSINPLQVQMNPFVLIEPVLTIKSLIKHSLLLSRRNLIYQMMAYLPQLTTVLLVEAVISILNLQLLNFVSTSLKISGQSVIITPHLLRS